MSATSFAASSYGITLPDGNFIPLEGLTNTEQAEVISKASVINEKFVEKQTAAAIFAEKSAVLTNPEELDKWRVLITSTIKDIASDLNIAVNDFIRTPAGIGVSALIIYKVAKDSIEGFLSTIFDVVFGIPLWGIIIFILFRIKNKYLSFTTIYERKIETVVDGKSKFEYLGPKRVETYPFRDKDSRLLLGIVLLAIGIIATVVMTVIVFN